MSPLDEVRALEARSFRAWPALESREVRGWVQRLSGGYTKRANSINALGPNSALTLNVKQGLEAPYYAVGLPPIWRLSIRSLRS